MYKRATETDHQREKRTKLAEARRYQATPDPIATVWRLPAVVSFTSLSRRTILRGPEGFPKPIKLGPHSIGWLRAEVEKWLADRIAERDEAAQ